MSAVTGHGMADLSAAIGRLVGALPEPVTDGRVRLWVDRAFTVKGAGTVLTGTLGAGRLAVGDELQLAAGGIRSGACRRWAGRCDQVGAVARVAVNLRGLDRDRGAPRGLPAQPGRLAGPATGWTSGCDPLLAEPAGELVLHLGSAAIPVRVRLLGAEHARLRLARPVPAQVGDRGVLRDPAQQQIVAGVQVLDPDPPALDRRGAAADRAAELASGVASSAGRPGAAAGRGAAECAATLGHSGRPAGRRAGARGAGWWTRPAGSAGGTSWCGLVDGRRAPTRAGPGCRSRRPGRRSASPDLALLRAGRRARPACSWSDGRLARPGVAAVGRERWPDRWRPCCKRLADRPFDAPERPELAEQGDRSARAGGGRPGRSVAPAGAGSGGGGRRRRAGGPGAGRAAPAVHAQPGPPGARARPAGSRCRCWSTWTGSG